MKAHCITFVAAGGLVQVRMPRHLEEALMRRIGLAYVDQGKTWVVGRFTERSEQGQALLAAWALLTEPPPGLLGPTGATGPSPAGVIGPSGSWLGPMGPQGAPGQIGQLAAQNHFSTNQGRHSGQFQAALGAVGAPPSLGQLLSHLLKNP